MAKKVKIHEGQNWRRKPQTPYEIIPAAFVRIVTPPKWYQRFLPSGPTVQVVTRETLGGSEHQFTVSFLRNHYEPE